MGRITKKWMTLSFFSLTQVPYITTDILRQIVIPIRELWALAVLIVYMIWKNTFHTSSNMQLYSYMRWNMTRYIICNFEAYNMSGASDSYSPEANDPEAWSLELLRQACIKRELSDSCIADDKAVYVHPFVDWAISFNVPSKPVSVTYHKEVICQLSWPPFQSNCSSLPTNSSQTP